MSFEFAKLKDIIGKVDFDSMLPKVDEPPNISTIDYLLKNLGIDNEKSKESDLLLRAYIYATIVVRRHLIEINDRKTEIKNKLSQIQDHGSYTYRKLKYFHKKNTDAEDEIVQFLSYRIKDFVFRNKSYYQDFIDRDSKNDKDQWMWGPSYNYHYQQQYYDPNFDFSTYVKFYNISDGSPTDYIYNIEKYTALKKESLESYDEEIRRYVDSKKLVSEMNARVENNYHVYPRCEIFNTLSTLFEDGKYQSFIVLATIQIEGIFYDWISLKNGQKDQHGTLVEKAEKAFKDHHHQIMALYPYFAFDIPDLRNEIAHKGKVEGRDIKQTAYELVLDLYCVLYLVERDSTGKFTKCLMIYNKMQEIDKSKYENTDEYNHAVTECLFHELFMSQKLDYLYFWELMLTTTAYKQEMDFYKDRFIYINELNLEDIVNYICNWIKSETFWAILLDAVQKLDAQRFTSDSGIIKFYKKMVNMYIRILSGEAKTKCCQINAQISKLEGATLE